jgi:uncharacterized peroxidase-related enzyme
MLIARRVTAAASCRCLPRVLLRTVASSASPPISRFPVPDDYTHLSPELQERMAVVEQKSGFMPNIFKALSHRPAELEAFWNFHDILMAPTDELSKADKEMIVVTTSGENRCHYCVVAHGAILRILSKRPLLADQLANNYRKADIDARERAMLDYAVKVSQRAPEIGPADVAALAEHGFSEKSAWDIAAVASFFAMSNRLANAITLRPNDEFVGLGR